MANNAFIVAGIKNLLKKNYGIDPQTVDVEARVDATLDYKNVYKVRLLLHDTWLKSFVSNARRNFTLEIGGGNFAVSNVRMEVEEMMLKKGFIKSVMSVEKSIMSQNIRGVVQSIAQLNVRIFNRVKISKKDLKTRSLRRYGLKTEGRSMNLRLKKRIINYLCTAILIGGLCSTHLKRDVFYAEIRTILMFIILMKIDRIIELPISHHYAGDVI